jgi:hypothetical protein
MNTEVVAVGRVRTRLPSVPDYFGAIWDLGRKTFKPALPALAFVYFYHLGVGAYLMLSDNSYTQGMEALGVIGPQLAVIAAFVPLLLVIYTVFLPLQDSILRGRPVSFLSAVRRVFEAAWNLTLSGIVQALILFLPFAVLCVVVLLMLPTSGGNMLGSTGSVAGLLYLMLMAGFAWALVAVFFLVFATPALVLDDEGPIQSLGTSLRLVLSHFGGILGRFVAFSFLAFVIFFMVSMPTAILKNIGLASGIASVPLKLASLIWSSAVDTLFVPFQVAAVIVMYRALVPPAAAARAGAPITIEEDPTYAVAPRAPFE